MNHKLEDLIDVKLVQDLQDKLNRIYSFPSAIIDNDGKVLTAVAWQDICTKFHRINPESEKECIKSDQYILEHLNEANPAVSYKCPHGLIDNATPIIIDGKHYGNFFTGQFFLDEKPDVEFFKQQASKFGFDEEEYLKAVEKVPIWKKEKLGHYLDFIKGFIEVIAGIGLKSLREIESNNALEIANKKLEAEIAERTQAEKLLSEREQLYHKLFDHANEGLLLMTFDGEIVDLNYSFASMHGYSVAELKAMNIKDLDVLNERTFEERDEIMRRLNNGEVVRFEAEHYHKNGNIINIHVTTSVINIGDKNYFLAFHQDITERKRNELLLKKKNEKIIAQNEKLYQTNLELIASKEKSEESEKKYRLQFQNMSSYNSIYEVITDSNGKPCDFRFLMVNQAYEKYVGKKAEELIGKTLLEVYPDTEQYWIDKMAEAVLTDKPLYFESYSNVMDTYTDIELYVPQKGQLAMITSNINDRKKAENALRKSETIKNTMISNIGDVIVIIDKNGINQYKSPNITKLFGWQTEELIGKSTWDIIHPDDLEKGQKFFSNILSEPNATGSIELRYKCKDGNYVWIEINVINLLHDKDIQGILGNYHDITERKRVEEELIAAKEKAEENEIKYKSLFTNMMNAFGLHEMIFGKKGEPEDYIFLEVNPIWEKVVGIKAEDIVGKRIKEIMPSIEQDWLDKYGKVVRTGIPIHFTDYNDATKKYYDVSAYKHDGNKFAVVFNDVTDRINAEQELRIAKEKSEEGEYRLKLAAESGKFGIWDWNVKDNAMIWDERMFELYGITNDTFTNTIDAWINGLHPEDKQRALDECMAALNGDRDFNTIFRVLHPDGKVRYLKADALITRDSNGKAVRMIGLNVDITDVKLSEIELEKYRNHLEELVELRTTELDNANELLKREIEKQKEYELLLQQSLLKEKELSEIKSRFISTTSHEFRTPLTAAQLSVELLQRNMAKWDEDKKTEHFDRIKNSISYLTKLLDDILTISRTDSGTISSNPSNLDLKEFAKECVDEAKSLSRKHKINLSYNASATKYLLDEKLMKFIVSNLLSNAIKYSPDGEIVELAISNDEKHLFINIIDEGIGIPNDEIDHIFDSFYRTKNAEDIEGTGLGLAIVKSAVDLHKGEIKVSSELGKGTTFTVKIPITIDTK